MQSLRQISRLVQASTGANGPAVATAILPSKGSVRAAHTDLEAPDFTAYRRESTKDPTARSENTKSARRSFTYMMGAGAGVCSVYVAGTLVKDAVGTMSAAANVLSVSKMEVDLDEIPEGKNMVFKFQGKPLFVRHRTDDEIATERSVNMAELRDPEPDEARAKNPKYLVVLGICTHLGCVPISNAGEWGGYYCPCHGSHYDSAGRIRKGPAPTNLEIPDYVFKEGKGNFIIVG